MDSKVLKPGAGQHKIFLQVVSFPLNYYFPTFAIDNGSLYITLRLGSLQL